MLVMLHKIQAREVGHSVERNIYKSKVECVAPYFTYNFIMGLWLGADEVRSRLYGTSHV